MQIWPAIDIRAGKCVRLMQGDYQQETVYGSSPADMAHRWVSEGAEGLHIVDLDGARDGQASNFESIAQIAKEVDVPLQVGGGIREADIISKFVDIGVQRLIVGTKALKHPDWAADIIQRFPNRILIGLDSRDGKAATDGWMNISDVSDIEFAREMSALPIAGIIYTDITKDGMLAGPNLEAMERMNTSVQVPVIASGGVTSAEDISNLAVRDLAGCIIGRALYEGKLTLREAIKATVPGVSAG